MDNLKKTKQKNYREWLTITLLIVIPLAVFWQALFFSFVWDDTNVHLHKNLHLRDSYPDNILWFWKSPYQGLYIPVSYTFWKIIMQMSRFSPESMQLFNPVAYHSVNLILHIINGLLLFLILKKIIKSRWAAVSGVLVFLVHPLQVESVVWVSELRGLLCSFFGLSALYIYLLSLQNKDSLKKFITLYVVSSLLFALSMLSKPSGIVVLLFAALFTLFIGRETIKSTILKMIPWGFICLPIIILTCIVNVSGAKMVHTPLWIRPFIWADSINFYIYKLIWPISLSISYGRTPQYVMEQWWFYVEWIIPLLILYVCWRLKKPFPLYGLTFLIFVAGFLPVSGLTPFIFQKWSTVADRYLYLSMIGVALGIAYTIEKLNTNRTVISCVSIILLFYCIRDYWIQIPVWENDVTLWSHCIKLNPKQDNAWINRGEAYRKLKDYELAISDFNQALNINPKNAGAYNGRGMIYSIHLNDSGKSIKDFTRALEINPTYVSAYKNRARAYAHLGYYIRAVKDLNNALELDPGSADLFCDLGNVYTIMKDCKQALTNYSRAIELCPVHYDTYYNRGNLYAQENDYENALDDYSKAIELKPDFPKALFNRALILLKQKKYEKALNDFSAAINLDPMYADAYVNRGLTYFLLENFDSALQDYSTAIKLNPGSPVTYYNRGNTYAALKDYQNAIKDYSEAIRLNPKYLKAYNNRLAAYLVIGESQKAKQDMDLLKDKKNRLLRRRLEGPVNMKDKAVLRKLLLERSKRQQQKSK